MAVDKKCLWVFLAVARQGGGIQLPTQELHHQVGQYKVGIFGLLHVMNGRRNIVDGQPGELASVVTRQAEGHGSLLIGIGNGLQDIRGIAAPGKADHEVLGAQEILDLFDKNIFIGEVIRIGHHRGHVVIQADDLDLLFQVDANALVDVAGEVRGRRRAAAIPQGEYRPAAPIGFHERIE